MDSVLAVFATAGDLALVILGFGFIIFVHELGHFLAARWAGIRVLAFAIGFGPPLLTWRKGIGWRRRSTEPEYLDWVRRRGSGPRASAGPLDAISPTEYRLNALPLGGYVKMLGQDDIDPTATSDAPDSFQNCKPWRRMVVISAGVVMNIILAAVLFVIVFSAGLKTEPPIVGDVVPGQPASKNVATNARQLGVLEPGLQPADRVISINGSPAQEFQDITLATAMAAPGQAIRLVVDRAGVDRPLNFSITPEVGALSGLLEMGIGPGHSATILEVRNEKERALLDEALAGSGLAGVEPGMTLVRVGSNSTVRSAADLTRAIRHSGGSPVEVEFAGPNSRITRTITPRPELALHTFKRPDGNIVVHRHLLGLTPVMTIENVDSYAAAQGLKAGDVVVRAGAIQFPSMAQGSGEINAHRGDTIDLVVARKGEDGATVEVPIKARVKSSGRIGLIMGSTADDSNLLASPPPELTDIRADAKPSPPPALSIIDRPGLRLVAVEGKPVSNFADIRRELFTATSDASLLTQPARVIVTVELARAGGAGPVREDRQWNLTADDIRSLHSLAWESPVDPSLFKFEETELRAADFIDALRMGVARTHNVMMMTYVTFARLFQQTVKIEHLKGPVGIAHIGTKIADRGFVWLLFFMALISVNLAVVNFLPLPIVDGGQFIFLIIEQIRGKPVPPQVLNAATVVGLVLIGSMFIVVTFHDVMGLFGR